MEKLYATIKWDPTIETILGPEFNGEILLIDSNKLYVKLNWEFEDLDSVVYAITGDMPMCEISPVVFDELVKDAIDMGPFDLDFEMRCKKIPGYDIDYGLITLLVTMANKAVGWE